MKAVCRLLVMCASLAALAVAAAGGDAAKLAKIDAEIAQARSQGAEAVRNNVLGGMAVVSRKASDADLTEYVKLFESENGKWLTNTLSHAVLEEVKSASTHLGERIVAGTYQAIRELKDDQLVREQPKEPADTKAARTP